MLRDIKVRCIASGAFSAAITMQQLAQLVGVTAITATTSSVVSPLIRLRRISMWSPVTTAGTSVSCALTWVNMNEDFETPPITYSDSSVSFDRPAHISKVPPQSGVSSKWHSSTLTDNILFLVVPTGSTVDFEIDFLLNDNVNQSGNIGGPTLVGATVGIIYHHPIGVLVPQIVNQL